MLTHIASVSRMFARLVPWANAVSWVSADPPLFDLCPLLSSSLCAVACLAVAHLALFESWWPNWLAGQWPRSSAEELQGSVAGLEARNAQLVREVDELKSRLATAGSPNPTMRGSSSNERTKTTTTRERDDTKTGVSLGGATRRSAPDEASILHINNGSTF